MASRHRSDLGWWMAGLLAFGLLALAALFAGLQGFLALVGIGGALAAAYLVWQVDPAYTFSAAIFLSPFAGNWQALGLPSGFDPDRILLSVAILQVVFRAPMVRDRPPFKFMPAHLVMGLALLYVVASAFFAGTLFVKAPLFKIVDDFGLLPFLTFVTAPIAFRTTRHRRILLLTLVIMGAYLGFTVLCETIHLDAFIFPKYILNPHYGIHVGRGRGPFVDAVANGFGLFVCAAVSVIAVVTWKGRRARMAAAGIALLCFAGSFMSLERSVWIGVTAGSVLTMLSVRRLRPYFVPVALVAGLAVGSALVFIPSLRSAATKRANMIGTVYDRQNLIRAGLNMIEAKPLTGFGWQRFQADSQLYFRQSQDYPLTATKLGIHNFLLSYAVDLGLPGLTLWALALLIGLGGVLVSRGPPDLAPWRAALLAVLIMFAVVASSVPPSLFPNLSLWMLGAVGFSGAYARRTAPIDDAPAAVPAGAPGPPGASGWAGAPGPALAS